MLVGDAAYGALETQTPFVLFVIKNEVLRQNILEQGDGEDISWQLRQTLGQDEGIGLQEFIAGRGEGRSALGHIRGRWHRSILPLVQKDRDEYHHHQDDTANPHLPPYVHRYPLER